MNKKQNTNLTLIQFMLRAQQIAQDRRSDKGYAMLMTSMITIAMFSMLAAYMTMTNLNKSASAAYTKSNSTFYAAESGLNARAQLIRQKVGSYDVPTGLSPTSINQCLNAASTATIQYDHAFGTNAINDFGCKNYTYNSASGTSGDLVTSSGQGAYNVTKIQNPDAYIATTYIIDNPDRLITYPKQSIIPGGDLFAGMRMLEYTQRVYSTAKIRTAGTTPEQTVLQLDFQTRFVPLFQFAAFYDQDLEITPGPDMAINGRIHTNGNLYLTSGSSSTVCAAGQISAKGSIYNRRKHAGNSSEQGSNGKVYLYPTPGTCVNGMTQVAANRLYNSITYTTNADPSTSDPGNYDSTNPANMAARFGTTNVRDRVDNIKIPSPDFLAKTGTSGALSVYYTKADLRIEMKSNPAASAIPFNFTSLASGMGDGTTCASFNVAADRVDKDTLRCMKFDAGQLHSLRQPVLVMTGQSTDDTRLCTAELVTPATSTAITALTIAQKTKIARALQTAIVSQKEIVNYSDIKSKKLSDFSEIKTLFGTYLTAAGITTVTAENLTDNTFSEIAAIAGDCFKPAAIQTYNTFYNNRERANHTTNAAGGNITMLQTNIESLTIWNRDGLYVKLAVDASSNPQIVAATTNTYQLQANGDNSGQGNSGKEQVFKLAAIPTSMTTCTATDNLCLSSFRHLGLAGVDNSERGLVFHLTVDNNNTPNTTTAYTAKKSPYGFAITGGRQLPEGLTIATDQAAYLQGDYNYNAGTIGTVGAITGNGVNIVTSSATYADTSTPPVQKTWTAALLSNTTVSRGGHKFPASILADSINVISNNCLDTNATTGTWRLNCGIAGAQPGGSETTINAAFLGGSDIMPFSTGNNYSGGLHNYPRLHEDWGTLNYTGSFVSLGAPLQVSGTWDQTIYGPPTRNWAYDTDFNDVTNLPPLTPNIVYLKQRVFSRGYGGN